MDDNIISKLKISRQTLSFFSPPYSYRVPFVFKNKINLIVATVGYNRINKDVTITMYSFGGGIQRLN